MRTLERIVLASASPRRLELLRALGLEVLVVPSDYHEPDVPNLTPRELAIAHAREKAMDVRNRVPHNVLVAADTVVDVDGTPLGKPKDAAHAAAMLRALSGRTHLVHTAFALALPDGGALVEACETASVRFFALDDDEIAGYVAGGEPMDKAGAYGIQGYGATLVERIEGDFYTVMGLPVARLARALRGLGIALPTANPRLQP